jgi:trans-aconitate 2-methyltransferase
VLDAVLSTATFHWIPDHERLFANLAAGLRPGGQLVARCGDAGNLRRVGDAARAAGVDLGSTKTYPTPEETEARLTAAGASPTSSAGHATSPPCCRRRTWSPISEP